MKLSQTINNHSYFLRDYGMPGFVVCGHYLISYPELASEVGYIITLTLWMRELKSKKIIKLSQVTNLLHVIIELINFCTLSHALIQYALSPASLYFPFLPIFSSKSSQRGSQLLWACFLIYKIGSLMWSIFKQII